MPPPPGLFLNKTNKQIKKTSRDKTKETNKQTKEGETKSMQN